MQASGVSWGGTIVRRAIVLLSMSAGCASGMGDKRSGQPCTRTQQCASPLICSGGTCGRGEHRHPSERDAQIADEDAGMSAVGK
jgi:hypothetical protein